MFSRERGLSNFWFSLSDTGAYCMVIFDVIARSEFSIWNLPKKGFFLRLYGIFIHNVKYRLEEPFHICINAMLYFKSVQLRNDVIIYINLCKNKHDNAKI